MPLDRVYRQLFNPALYLLAYGRLYSNKGAMTPGVTRETVDGMSLATIDRIIDAVRHERYRWKPVKRVHIPKRSGRTRPLGLPTWSDKLVAEVVRLLLEAYYDVQFSDRSHGFRPGRGCHTALSEVVEVWKGTHWFIEADISRCFEELDHTVMLETVGERIHDNRFLRLLGAMLKAGYLEDWKWGATLSGAPQGGPASPILSNIYLDRLDNYVVTHLLPDYNRGERRAVNPAYQRIEYAIARARRRGDRQALRRLRQQRRRLPSQDPHDPGYRRLRYVRYCDDFLFGFSGPKAEAREITERVRRFLCDELKLELSREKTLITHAQTGRARFLGYHIVAQHSDTKITRGRRAVNGAIGPRIPPDVIRQKRALYYRRGEPAQRPQMLHDDDYTIVSKYQAEYRGVVQYYLLAGDVYRLQKLRWVMETSMLKTLASKPRSNVNTMARKYKATVRTDRGPRTCFQVTVQRDDGKKPLVARFGGIPLHRQPTATLTDRAPTLGTVRGNELIHRLLAGGYEMCGATDRVEVHHVRHLADLNKPGRREKPAWARLMAMRRRTTLVVCRPCHEAIHAGRSTTQPTAQPLESDMR
ncbi:reverse transcriptase domain-containing protein [Frankia sp. Cpl3]|nr:reverse transcriptase domain-containing protein [Frankia sp. Cpl3]